MSNQIKIKHGNTAPQNSDLEPYELGWHGNYLYIKLPNESDGLITKIGTSNLTNIETSIDTMSDSIGTIEQSVDRIDTSINNINISIQEMDQEITTLDDTTTTIQASLLNKITKPSVSGTSGQFLTSDGANNTYWSTLNIVDNLTTQSPTKTLSANMGYQLKLLIDQLGVDFIVAQGTSGNWTYRKWNSGFVELWHSRLSIPINAGSAVSNNVVVNFPFNITDPIVSFGLSQNTSSAGNAGIIDIANLTTTQIVLRSHRNSATNDSWAVEPRTFITVVGKWK